MTNGNGMAGDAGGGGMIRRLRSRASSPRLNLSVQQLRLVWLVGVDAIDPVQHITSLQLNFLFPLL